MNPESEREQVEKPAIECFAELGWRTQVQPDRPSLADVVLIDRLRPALERLNPTLPEDAITAAVDELTRDRGAMSLESANREIYHLLKDGVSVRFRDPEGDGDQKDRVKVIDWTTAENNDFVLVDQFTVLSQTSPLRPDLVGFVNGLPWVLIELKASTVRLETAYRKNIGLYKNAIPQIFWYNAFLIVSNGTRSKLGSLTAGWDHYGEWPKINAEGETGVISLDTLLRATCTPPRLLDLVENYTVFQDVKGGISKLVAKNHQYLGVEHALEAFHRSREEKSRRLGVFWHTQGSGKSASMMFFAQKVLRKVPGNWTFVLITDRKDLDDQIYKHFSRAGIVTKETAQATSSAHLKILLRGNERYIFTLIHKFRTDKGVDHEVLSTRDDIVVIADEAHRSQYETLAMNIRRALPNASFIAFTGTPLLAGEEKTRQEFGEYVSVYNFKQAVDDGATVPLYYESRIPELQLTNEDLNEDMERLLEEAELDASQEDRLEQEFSRQYQLLVRDDRLETVAGDLVEHFSSRGFLGKAMVVSIDKATAIKMHDKVRAHWQGKIDRLSAELEALPDDERRPAEETLRYLRETDMAVIVSAEHGEAVKLDSKGVDIRPHRRRLEKNSKIDEDFKDPDHPLRLVFVCAMWMTGFDVPSCSTIYLDKPMRNHTLMQTIARANRRFPEKENGLIVDYVGVFRDLQRALAIYGSASGGGVGPGESPVAEKSALVAELRGAILEAETFLTERGVDLEAIRRERGWQFLAVVGKVKALIENAAGEVVRREDDKQRFLSLVRRMGRLLKAVLPDPAASELIARRTLIERIAGELREPPADIYGVMNDVATLLDASIGAESYAIHEPLEVIDLSRIDLDALAERFARGSPALETDRLKNALRRKVEHMVRFNPTRLDFQQRLEQLINAYNTGAKNVEEFFRELVAFARSLQDEERRALREKLAEEELAIFDLLTRPEMRLGQAEEQQVRQLARELLGTLKREKLVIDWRQRQQARDLVRLTIEEMLDTGLPEVYTEQVFGAKCEAVFRHVEASYYGAGWSVYETAA